MGFLPERAWFAHDVCRDANSTQDSNSTVLPRPLKLQSPVQVPIELTATLLQCSNENWCFDSVHGPFPDGTLFVKCSIIEKQLQFLLSLIVLSREFCYIFWVWLLKLPGPFNIFLVCVALAHPKMARQGEVKGIWTPKKDQQMNRMKKQTYS